MKISPFTVQLGEARHGTWGGETPTLKYSYHYRRPFFRTHSVSLGAHGTVETYDPSIIGDNELMQTAVTITKSSNPDSIRNKERVWPYLIDDLEDFYGDELMHTSETPELLLARMAVCKAIIGYSETGIHFFDIVTGGVFLD